MFSSPVSPLLCLCMTVASAMPAWSQTPTPPIRLAPKILIVGPDGEERLVEAAELEDEAGAKLLESLNAQWPNRVAIGVVAQELPEGISEHLGLEPGQGVLIGRTFEEGPAAKAGILPHDIIVQIGNEPVRSPEDLLRLVQQSEGNELEIVWLHQGKKQMGKVTPVQGKNLQAMQQQELEFMMKNLSKSLQNQVQGFQPPGILLQPLPPQDMNSMSDVQQKLTEIQQRMAALEESLKDIRDSLKQD